MIKFLFFFLLFILTSCRSPVERILINSLWAIEEVQIDEEVYQARSLFDNLLNFEKDGRGSGFIFQNSPYYYNKFYWDFNKGKNKAADSIVIHESNNEYFNRSFAVNIYSKNGVYILVLTSMDVKIRCFKWL